MLIGLVNVSLALERRWFRTAAPARRPPTACGCRRGAVGMTTVIFACVHNAGRSQMAAALFNQLADPQAARAVSAGTVPGAAVHPEVVTVMRELGIDLADARPTLLTDAMARGAPLDHHGLRGGVSVRARSRRDDWPLLDPKGQSIAAGPRHS